MNIHIGSKYKPADGSCVVIRMGAPVGVGVVATIGVVLNRDWNDRQQV